MRRKKNDGKNTELMAVAAPVSTGDNIYPNLPYSSMGAEIQEKRMFCVRVERPVKNRRQNRNISAGSRPRVFSMQSFLLSVSTKRVGYHLPFYVAGTIGFAVYTIRKSGISWEGEHIWRWREVSCLARQTVSRTTQRSFS